MTIRKAAMAALVLAAGAAAPAAHAEWSLVAEGPSGAAYIDEPSIETLADDQRVVVELYDFAQARQHGAVEVRSILLTSRYHCGSRTNQTINFLAYSEAMGRGEVVAAQKDMSSPARVAADSIAERVLHFICERQATN
jgi:hypothetical protein